MGTSTEGRSTRPPRFFLDGPPKDGPPLLLPGESEHALRVLRLRPGDLIEGLDGAGRAWPLRIVATGRNDVGLEVVGASRQSPAPGEENADLPWIEVAVAWPKRTRVDGMIGPLVQLGAAAVTPLVASYGGDAPVPTEPDERWHRLAREACKQSGRLWLPTFRGATSPDDVLEREDGAAILVLDPDGPLSLDTCLRSLRPAPLGAGTRERPIVLVIGPEGGFSPEEKEAFLLAGVTSARLAPHVLRIETAAVAAMSVAANIMMA